MISLNSSYGVRNDKNCSFIYILDDSFDILLTKLPEAFEIPSLYGYILSFFQKPRVIEEAIFEISESCGIKTEIISKFTHQITNNKTCLEIKYAGQSILLPPYLLTESYKNQNKKAKIFTEKNFNPLNRFIKVRPSSPNGVTIMLTSKCNTDCIYCYADRNNKVDFELKKIMCLIEDCYQSGVFKLTLSGGDIFAYKDWEEVIHSMYNHDYISFISTKIPLSEEKIIFIKENGIREIQFSLDAIDPIDIYKILKRDDHYIEEVMDMFYSCYKHGIKVNMKTVLTKYNAKIETLQSLYNLLTSCHIYSWNIVPAFFSYYKDGYENYQADKQSLQQCEEFIEKISKESKVIISYNKLKEDEGTNIKYKTTDSFFKYNKGCITTSHNISINVFGQVTICELLYNRDKFHLGNIKHKTIKELWNSELITNFFDFSLSSLPRNPESPCYQCEEYKRCKIGNTKKVCLVDIVNIYGADKWDYPDPRCPHAPECNMDQLIK